VENWGMFVDFMMIGGMVIMASIILYLLKSTTHYSKKLLIGFFISGFFFCLYYYAFSHKARILGAIAILFGNGMGFYLGPITFCYIQSLFKPSAEVVRKLLIYLIPFYIFWVFVNVPVAISMVSDSLRNYGSNYAALADYFNLIENLFFMAFLFLSLRAMRTMKHRLYQFYSEVRIGNLVWYRSLLLSLITIVILDSLFSVYELIYPAIPWNIGTIIAFLFVILYSLLGYQGIFQANLNVEKPASESRQNSEKSGNLSPENPEFQAALQTNLSPSEVLHYTQKLKKLMEHKKVFMNESLSLNELADHLEMNSKKLSELLNQHMHTNFYSLVNEYRVREVQAKLKSPENARYTLVGLAYDSGFQSKASFNRVFKEKTGMSPSSYRKKHLPEMSKAG
jgi:AraC-like DNA-binding protein